MKEPPDSKERTEAASRDRSGVNDSSAASAAHHQSGSGGKLNDNELLQRHIDGDEQAFPALVHRYRKELYNFLGRFTGDPTLAEDIFQETFLQLHLSAGAFDPTRRLKPWLFTIAANKARDAMRKRTRRQAVPLNATIGANEGGETTFIDLIPANIPQPSETLANLETRRAVQQIIKDMPENLRIVLLLNYFHELAYKEIAEILGVPLGTIKSRLHAAVKYFAKRWKAAAELPDHE